MGIETEYAISALYPWGRSLDPSEIVNRMFGLARERLVHLPDVGGGLYLGTVHGSTLTTAITLS